MYNRDMQESEQTLALGDLVYWPPGKLARICAPPFQERAYLGVVVEIENTNDTHLYPAACGVRYRMGSGGYWHTTVMASLVMHGGSIISRSSLKKPPFTKTQGSAKRTKRTAA